MVDGLCARDVLHHEISCFSILRWQLSVPFWILKLKFLAAMHFVDVGHSVAEISQFSHF